LPQLQGSLAKPTGPFPGEIAPIRCAAVLSFLIGGVFAATAECLPQRQRFCRSVLKECPMTTDSAPEDRPPIIVTDSTCDLPPGRYDQYDIRLVPLKVMFGEESYRSGIDMDLPQFVERLERGDTHPTTSQPTVDDFATLYEGLIDTGRPILSIHVSEGLSGTVNAARLAAQRFPDAAISVWNSGTISAALGMQVLAAARAAAAGYSVEHILPLLEQTHAQTDLLFSLDDLSFLAKGGRIGAVQYHVAQALHIKPIITVSKSGDTAGTYISAGRVRSLEKAVAAFVRHIVDDVGAGGQLRAMTFHGVGRTPELAARLGEKLQENFDCVFLETAYSTPVLGVHVGPLALDIAYAAGDWPV
jgi:DegV family protein with EDD domain